MQAALRKKRSGGVLRSCQARRIRGEKRPVFVRQWSPLKNVGRGYEPRGCDSIGNPTRQRGRTQLPLLPRSRFGLPFATFCSKAFGKITASMCKRERTQLPLLPRSRFFLAHASVYHLQLFSSKAFEKITASTRKRGIIRSTELSPSLWEGRRIRLRIGRGGFKNFDCSISERCLPSPDLRHDE